MRTGSVGLTLLLSAALPAAALAAGLGGGRTWLLELLLVLAVGQGISAGLLFPRFYGRSGERGALARYVIFVAAVLFAAVEAYAVGAGMVGGAPAPAAAMLLPPIAVAGLAMRSALAFQAAERSGGGERSRGAETSNGAEQRSLAERRGS
ncbi:MAG: hypothetical protein ACE5HQ_10585 [Gemmatimonadota bacterium]